MIIMSQVDLYIKWVAVVIYDVHDVAGPQHHSSYSRSVAGSGEELTQNVAAFMDKERNFLLLFFNRKNAVFDDQTVIFYLF